MGTSTRVGIHRTVGGVLTVLVGLAGAAIGQDDPWRSVGSIGESRSGRAIGVVSLGPPGEDALGRTRDQRPALLIVAGVDGRHAIGRLAADAVGERLLRDHRALLEAHTVYIITSLNPDGEGWLAGEGGARIDSGRNAAEVDADHDGRVGEDGGDDLNADGMVTMMRVLDPPAAYGLKAEWVIDEDEPRLMRKADSAAGETGRYALLIEGADNDGDGRFNEDGPGGSGGGGVDLDMNFPSHHPEHADGAGAYPLSEPESRALAEWLTGRDNIVAVLVYGPHDNLVKAPGAGKFDESGRMPTGLEQDDEAYHKKIGEVFTEITGMTGAPTRETGGSLVSYAYTDFGVWAFSTPVWVRPDQVKKEDEPKEDGEGGAGAGAAEDDGEPSAPADEPEPVDEAQALRDRGVPENLIRFLTSDADVRAAMMAEYEAMSPEEQQREMAALAQLPEDVRVRVMALAQGQPDPGAPAGGAVEADAKPDGKKKSDKPKADEAELAWLKHSDEQRGGAGFVDWAGVEHPQLGPVEVGGFVPGFRVNPPEAAREGLFAEQAEFAAALLERLPTLEVGEPEVERVGAGLWRIRVRATNTGYLPTRSAMGVKARRLPPEVVLVEVEPERIISGDRAVRMWSIAGSGGHADAEWIVRGDAGDTVEVRTRSATFGDRVQHVTLREGP